MLRNFFARNNSAGTHKNTMTAYLHAYAIRPSKLASMLAVLVVPVGVLGWWCYSVILSIGAMAPLQ